MDHAYWGRAYSPAEVATFLQENDIAHRVIENQDEMLDLVADSLMRGKVVGWFQGRFEWGPRALGHRSILADPSKP
jgi:carbamoyltransferase